MYRLQEGHSPEAWVGKAARQTVAVEAATARRLQSLRVTRECGCATFTVLQAASLDTCKDYASGTMKCRSTW